LIGVYKKHIIKTVNSGARDRQQRNAADNPLEFLKNTYSGIPPIHFLLLYRKRAGALQAKELLPACDFRGNFLTKILQEVSIFCKMEMNCS